MKVKPREFNRECRGWYSNGHSDGSKMQLTPTAEFVAQDLDEAQKDVKEQYGKQLKISCN